MPDEQTPNQSSQSSDATGQVEPAAEPVATPEQTAPTEAPVEPSSVGQMPTQETGTRPAETMDPRVSPEDDSKKLGAQGGNAGLADTAQMPADEPNAVAAPAPGQSAPKSAETGANSYLSGLLQKARQIFNLRKQKKLIKILDYVDKNGRINNGQVEKLLHVSDATASRYLRALVKEGKLAPMGKGKNTYYQKW